MIAGIILSAGASRRMGTPKALLDYRGETFLNRLIRVLGAVCDPVIIVLGNDAEKIRASAEGEARFIVNPDPARGQLSSLQTGIESVPANADGFMFVPVDCPAVEQKTVEKIARTFVNRLEETLLVIPRFEGKRGHPVCAAQSIARELLALPATAQAREVIHAHVAQTLYLDVDDVGILTDIDDPVAYSALIGQAAR